MARQQAHSPPSIILCSGAWHTEFHIRPCVPYFQQAGYNIIPSPLLLAGNDIPVDDAIQAIQTAAERELNAGHDIVFILHSAAGRIGSEAVNRILAKPSNGPGKISRILYLGSFIDWIPIITHLMETQAIEFLAEAGPTRAIKPKECFFSELSDAEAQPFIDALTLQYGAVVELSSDAFTHLQKTAIICMEDGSVPLAIAEGAAKDYGMDIVRWEGTGHCPFTTIPEEFVKKIDSILKSTS